MTGPAPATPCPICHRPATERARPFCSARCADVDLHRWVSGAYAIPVAEDEPPSDDEDDTSGQGRTSPV